MAICCRLTSTLGIVECSISINISTSTEIIKECTDNSGNTTDVLTGATTGNLSLNSYATDEDGEITIHTECAESATLSVPWVRKYDCDADITYFINGGNGTSTMIGTPDFVTILTTVTTTKTLSASASGPSSMYSIQDQINGYGLSYTGGPLEVSENILVRPLSDIIIDTNLITELGLSEDTSLYLQNFNLSRSPGELPTVNYSFVFSI